MSNEDGSTSILPTPFQIGACRLVLGAVGERANVTALHGSYEHTASDGIYRSNDLLVAEQYLIMAGALLVEEECLEPTTLGTLLCSAATEDLTRMLVLSILQAQDPLWLSAATDGGLREEFLPERELHALHELGLYGEEREALLLAAGRKANPEAMAKAGAAGEEEVIRACREAFLLADRRDLAEQVLHVSLISDQLGYDVKSPTLNTGHRHLEVKTCSGYGERLTIYLSRNEAEVGQRDTAWRLVVCRLRDAHTTIEGWCTYADIEQMLPHDGGGYWASAKLSLEKGQLVTGLPLFDAGEPSGVPAGPGSERL